MGNPADPRAQAELDAQFTLDSIPNLDEVSARRTKAALDCLAHFAVQQGIAYGTHPDETLNIFPPATSGALAPVQVFIHGGFWRSMRADQFSFLAPGFVPFGAALVIIDYPLIPDVRLGDIVESCRSAVAWVYKHGRDFGLDPSRIYISGNSAGGHLVAELMDSTWMARHGLPDDAIKGGTAISGLYELAPVRASFQNEFLRFTPEEVETLSPLRREIRIKAPLIATVGGNETEEFLRQTADFATALTRAGADVTHMVVPGTDHITVVLDALAKPDEGLNRAVRGQMGIL